MSSGACQDARDDQQDLCGSRSDDGEHAAAAEQTVAKICKWDGATGPMLLFVYAEQERTDLTKQIERLYPAA